MAIACRPFAAAALHRPGRSTVNAAAAAAAVAVNAAIGIAPVILLTGGCYCSAAAFAHPARHSLSAAASAARFDAPQGAPPQRRRPAAARGGSDGGSASSGDPSTSSSNARAPARASPSPSQATPQTPSAVADVVVAGGGAAGLAAAYFAAKAGAKVLVLERTREAGKKVLMSGGTRCNILPLYADPEADFWTESPRSALRAAFSTWTVDGAREWLERDIGLRLALEEDTSKWFPASNSGRDVRDALVAACRRAGASFAYGASVEGLERLPGAALGDNDGRDDSSSGAGEWLCHLGSGNSSGGIKSSSSSSKGGSGRSSSSSSGGDENAPPPVRARAVIIATGGFSYPIVGTDGTGHRILQGLGHRLAAPYPALTPLAGPHPSANGAEAAALAGLTLPTVRLSVFQPPKGGGGKVGGGGGKGGNKPVAVSRRGGFLFTHRGFSGPSVLDASHHIAQARARGLPAPVLRAAWTGDDAAEWDARLRAGGAALASTVLQRGGVRERLALALVARAGAAGKTAAQLRKEERAALVADLTSFELCVTSDLGYKQAEVTGGGVPLTDVDPRTGESRVHPRLYLAGEVLDVTGRIGGFNFLWAWMSGRAAGRAAAAAAAGAAGAAAVAAGAAGASGGGASGNGKKQRGG